MKKSFSFPKTTFGQLIMSLALLVAVSCNNELPVQPSASDLQTNALSTTWDEAFPLGNAFLGELLWQKDDALRFSLDHSDVWDLRPTEAFQDSARFKYKWVKECIDNKDNKSVMEILDDPYSFEPAPAKIPCAALEFSANGLGKVNSARLYINNALCRVTWENGVSLQTFVCATEPVGWFVFDGIKDPDFVPMLRTPRYAEHSEATAMDQSGQEVRSLGYEQGEVVRSGDKLCYHQKGWGDFSYDVVVTWKRKGEKLYGVWSVSTSLDATDAEVSATEALERGYHKDYQSHISYWKPFWEASSIKVPDEVLQKQYDSEMYKLGSVARENSRPISLQAVWTADNGMLPPWKGDYHNDLNTQLSYWPVYIGNHLQEGLSYLNTQWELIDAYRDYAHQFFDAEGLMIPGVATLDGKPMGGWPQYSMSPTVASWIAQHFYLHWKYSADDEFLRESAYPFVKEVVTALESVSYLGSDGYRTLPLSTSPEIYDNSLNAWFHVLTNYDNALMTFSFGAAAEMAAALNLAEQAAYWQQCRDEMPPFDVDETGALTFAKGFPYNESHRHFSHAMAIFPLGLIDWSDTEVSKRIIKATIAKLDEYGPDWWCGYSYAWLGNMKARAFDGEGAAEALRTFADCFCLPNSFHANGDQTKSGKSKFIYRPFTLEGNFSFASGVQEMLLQSHTGVIRVFPAVPSSWKDASFRTLRARGAFLVSAEMKDGEICHIEVLSEKGGKLVLAIPGEDNPKEFDTKPGDLIEWNR